MLDMAHAERIMELQVGKWVPLEHLLLQLLPSQRSLLQLLQHGLRHSQLVLGQHAHLHWAGSISMREKAEEAIILDAGSSQG